MKKSKAFAEIYTYVWKVIESIPNGKITTCEKIGSFLNIMPRHVAYFVCNLKTDVNLKSPWHRVVGVDGRLLACKNQILRDIQAEKLINEGHSIHDDMVVMLQDNLYIPTINTTKILPKEKYGE